MPPSLVSLLAPDRVRTRVEAADKQNLIDQALDLLQGHPSVLDFEALKESVWAREEALSTGVGLGLGLPHARTPAVSETLAVFLTTAQPVPFEALDGEPVMMLMLLAGPESLRGTHVQILGRISRLVSDGAFRQRLLDATSGQAIMAAFADAPGA